MKKEPEKALEKKQASNSIPKEKGLDLIAELQKKRQAKKIILISLVFVIGFFLIASSLLVYVYFNSPEKTLQLGAEIESVVISEDGMTAYVKIKAGNNVDEIKGVKFVFVGSEGKEYVYETSEGAKELSVPFEISFWDKLFGTTPDFKGGAYYSIPVSGVEGLDNFNDIKEVGAGLGYKTKKGEEVESPILDTAKPTYTPTSSGGGGTTPPSGTTPEPDCTVTNTTYSFSCSDNDVYWFDNCDDRGDLKEVCSGGCVNGSCVEAPDETAFDGWRAVIPLDQEEYEAGTLPGEGMQYPHSMVRSYSNPEYIYLAIDCGQGWRSRDGGETWERFLAKGLGTIYGQSIEVDPANPNTVFITIDNLWIDSSEYFQGLYKSIDRGDNWEFVLHVDWAENNRWYKHNIAYALNSISGDEAKIWYAAFADKGLYKSIDGGDNWILALGLDGHAPIYALYVHPINSDIIYLGSDEGLYESTDGGTSIHSLGDLPLGDVTSIQILNLDPNIIYVTVKGSGLYKSTNAGTNFSALRESDKTVGCFINQGYPNVIYHLRKVNWDIGREGLEVSTDTGETWTGFDPADNSHPRSSLGRDTGWEKWFNFDDDKAAIIPNPDIECEAVGYARGHLWKTTNCSDFYHSNNLFGGYAWAHKNGIFFDSDNHSRFGFFGADKGMFISENSGKWFEYLVGPDSILYNIYGFGTESKDLGAGIFQPGTSAFVASGGNIWGTSRMGIIWSPDNEGPWEVTYLDGELWNVSAGRYGAFINYFYNPDNSSELFVSDIKSTDGGKTFSNISYLADNELEIYARCKSDPNVFYAMDNDGKNIYRSNNGGDDWDLYESKMWLAFPSMISGSFKNVFDVDPVDCNKIYTLYNDGDLASFDGGSWQSLGLLSFIRSSSDNTDLVNLHPNPGYPGIGAVIVDPNNNSIIYATVPNAGLSSIYRSTNGGDDWEDISYNLPRDGTGARFSINPYSGEIFAGGSSGTWVFPPPYASNTPIYNNSVSRPSCHDGLQNGDETGVDSGGSCFIPCYPGKTRDCEVDDEEGVCIDGSQTCQQDETWESCIQKSPLLYDERPNEQTCTDGLDNDCDGLKDCNDDDCSADSACEPPTDYISYWKFDERIGDETPDETGVNNGTLINNANIINNDVDRGNVLSLDGDHDYVSLVTSQTLNLTSQTVSLWIKPLIFDIKFIISTENSTNTYNVLKLDDSSGSFSVSWRNNSGSKKKIDNYKSLDGLENTWIHIVAVFDVNENDVNVSYYKNGDYQTSLVNSEGLLSVPWVSIGARKLYGGGYSFNGSIDDVMIFNRSLSASEIDAIFDAQSQGMVSTLSPFTRLLNWIKGILTHKTGKAIFTGNVVGNGEKDFKIPYIVFGVLAVIILIVVVVVMKVKKSKNKV